MIDSFKLKIKRFTKIMKIVVDKVLEKDLFTQAAALSYYCALSLAPLLILTVSVLSLMGQDTIGRFLEQVNLILGEQAGEVVTAIIISVKENKQMQTLSGIIGIGVLIFSASSVFSQLKTTISSIFSPDTPCEAEVPEGGIWVWVRDRVFSIGLMLGFIFLSVVSLLFSVVISLFLSGQKGFFAESLNQIIMFIIYSVIFGLVFYFVPSKKIPKRDCLFGGMISSLFFIIGKMAIGIYLGSAGVGSAYGAAGSLIVLLIWVYYSSFIFFVSGVATSLLPRIRKYIRSRYEKKV